MKQDSIIGKYEYLQHPADLKIKATGDNLEEALANIIIALTATRDDSELIQSIQKQKTQNITIKITSRRLTSLVFDLCQQYLECLEVKRLLPINFSSTKIKKGKSGFTLEGNFICVQLTNEQVDNQIKAPTYHEMKIESVHSKTQVTIVLDI